MTIIFCTGCNTWQSEDDFESKETYAQTMESPAEYELFCDTCGEHIDYCFEYEDYELLEALNKANVIGTTKGLKIE